MKTTRRFTLGLAKVTTALTCAVLMPVLIWVALGAAIYQRAQARKHGDVQMLKDILAAH